MGANIVNFLLFSEKYCIKRPTNKNNHTIFEHQVFLRVFIVEVEDVLSR